MAIKYAGSRNLIGYGAAQVYKETDLTKGVRYEHARAAAKAAAKAKKKSDDQKALTDLLKEVDYSDVRNADVDYFNDEFNKIYQQGVKVVSQGGNPNTDMELNKQINQFKANAVKSNISKGNYENRLKLVSENADYQGQGNVEILENEYSSPMFGENATFDSTEAQGTEGEAGYIAGTEGFGNKRLNPELHVAKHYKTYTEDINPQEITFEEGLGYKHINREGVTQFFTTKKEAEYAQVESAVESILQNHPYPELFLENQTQAAIKSGMYDEYARDEDEFLEDGVTENPDFGKYVPNGEVNVKEYIGDQVRDRVNVVGIEELTDLKAAPPRTYVNINQMEKEEVMGGTPLPAGIPTTWQGNWAGSKFKNQKLSFTRHEKAPVYDDDGKLLERGYSNIEVQIDKGKGGDSFFQISPSGAIKDPTKSETNIGGFQYLQSGQVGEGEEATTIPAEFVTSGSAIKFHPNSIEWYYTAEKDFEYTNDDGETIKIKKGQMVDDSLLDSKEEGERLNEGIMSIQPWMIGTEETGGMTMGIQFNDDTHAKFSSWVGGVAENRRTYETLIKKAGFDPKPLVNKSRKP